MNRLTTRRFLCLKCARPCGRISENIWVKGLRQGTARQARQGGRGRRGQGLGLYDPQRRLWRGYPYRAAIAVCCLFENLPQDAVYPSFSVDSEGRPLDGSALTRRRAFNGDFLFPGQRLIFTTFVLIFISVHRTCTGGAYLWVNEGISWLTYRQGASFLHAPSVSARVSSFLWLSQTLMPRR
jgi:hypothetical protein